MALHKDFVRKLWQLRKAPLYQVLGTEGLNFFSNGFATDGNSFSLLEKIDNILETIDFLEDEDYIVISSGQGNQPIPNLSTGLSPQSNQIDQIFYTQAELARYYTKILRVKRSLKGYIDDNFKTNAQRKYWRDLKQTGLSFVVALLSVFATGVSVYTATIANQISQESKQINFLSNQATIVFKDLKVAQKQEDDKNNIKIDFQYAIGNLGRVPATSLQFKIFIVPMDHNAKFPNGLCGNKIWDDAIREDLQPDVFLPFGMDSIVLPSGHQEDYFAFIATITFKDFSGLRTSTIWRKIQPKTGSVSYLIESEAKEIDTCLKALGI